MSMDDLENILNDLSQQNILSLKYPNPSSTQIFNYVAYELYQEESFNLFPETVSQPMQAERSVQANLIKYQQEDKTLQGPFIAFNQSFEDTKKQWIYNQPMKLRFKRRNSTQTLRKTHPTKNLLTTFKKAHLQYIAKKCPNTIKKNSVYKRISQKNNMSLKDYEDLYNDEEFSDALKLFFRNKVLYQELMASRVSLEQRKIYLKYIHRFEQAFNQKEFGYIGAF